MSYQERMAKIDGFARGNGLSKGEVKGGDFVFTYYRGNKLHKEFPVRIYIEGDGAAFIGGVPSNNPTPKTINMLRLASLDPRPNVIYLGRACQYTPMHKNPACNKDQWHEGRFSEQVVSSMSEAVASLSKSSPVELIGFSGGGGLVVLIAARSNNIKSITSLAGNLDHVEFNNHHGAWPMSNSLNPIDYVDLVRHIPQLHISGADDKRVPPFIAEKYVKKASSSCVKHKVLEGVSHNKHWEEYWEEIVSSKPISCEGVK